jgi:MFS family permease
MSFEEKLTWVNASATLVVVAVYAWIVGGQLSGTPVADIAYQWPMIIAMVAIILLTIVGAILTAIGTAVASEITGEGSLDEIGKSDERDKSISQRGVLIGYYVSSALMLGVLVLAMVEVEYFWIANAMFAAFVIAGLVASAVKLAGYRRGF